MCIIHTSVYSRSHIFFYFFLIFYILYIIYFFIYLFINYLSNGVVFVDNWTFGEC